MPTAHALIVDDSRTAQHRLRKLLGRYPIDVDMATSAEEALSYLSYRMPTVIFMDHHMEGMDGFEALKIIKANPSTATIPVIMYTSTNDDVYAGQARALGALDTLSKNLMKPSRVDEVLSKLNIFPAAHETNASPLPSTQPISTVAASDVSTTAISGSGANKDARKAPKDDKKENATASLARQLDIHVNDLRSELTEHTKFIVKRLGMEIQQSTEQLGRTSEDVPLTIVENQAREERRRQGLISNALLSVIVVMVAALSIVLLQSQQHLSDLTNRVNELADAKSTSPARSMDETSPGGTLSNALSLSSGQLVDTSALLRTVSWAMSVDTHFAYGETPLNERQVLILQDLVARLDDAGFTGFVTLDVHFGDFCLINSDGQFAVAPPQTPLADCIFVSDQRLDLSSDAYTSLPYVQFEQSSRPVLSGTIEPILDIKGFENPPYSYPGRTAQLTAAHWNSIAAKNQRVTVSVQP